MKFYVDTISKQLDDKNKLTSKEKLTHLDLQNLHKACMLLVPKKGDTPGKYNFKETLNNPASIAALAAGGVELSNFKNMINLYRNHAYSNWNNIKQTQHPELSSMVPIPLAAMKDMKGIAYEAWDLDSTRGSYGFFLGEFMKLKQDEREKTERVYRDLEQRLNASPELLAWARHSTLNKHSPNKLPDTSPTRKEFIDIWNQPFHNTNVSRFCRVCLLQIWLAGDIRLPGRTILDPFNWDRVPEYIPVQANPTEIPMEDL